jgi:universal stress protein A
LKYLDLEQEDINMFAPKKILVPTDFSEYADNALKLAIDIARQYKSKIFLLHVIDDRFQFCEFDYCLDGKLLEKIYKESLTNANAKMKKEVKKVTDNHSGIEIVFDTKRGIPYEEILEEQGKKGIDLIVIASHGKTGILKNLLGNIVEKVTKGAKCPVLLIRS